MSATDVNNFEKAMLRGENTSKLVDLTADSESEGEGPAVVGLSTTTIEGGVVARVGNKINAVILPKSVDKPMKHVPSFGGKNDYSSSDNQQNCMSCSLVPGGAGSSDMHEPCMQRSVPIGGGGSDIHQSIISSNSVYDRVKSEIVVKFTTTNNNSQINNEFVSKSRVLPQSLQSSVTPSNQTVYPDYKPPLAPVVSTGSSHSSGMSGFRSMLGTTNNQIGVYKPYVQYATITFTLINSREFVVRADNGFVPPEIINTFKKIEKVRFDWVQRCWIFSLELHESISSYLHSQRIHLEKLTKEAITTAQLVNNKQVLSYSEISNQIRECIPDTVMRHLAAFQVEAVQFVINNDGRALIADEMGLGKTRSAIGAACMYVKDWPVLIICPSTARYHWQHELLVLLSPTIITSKDVTVIDSSSHPIYRNNKCDTYKFYIISYNLMVSLVDKLEMVGFNCIIADESHYLKSQKAKRTKVILPMLKKSNRAILLSGTPALSRPIELFSQLHALDSRRWSSEGEFGKRYCRPKPGESKFSHSDFKGASNTAELHMILSATKMIRRLKADILTQLPPKQRFVERIQVNNPTKRDALKQILKDIVTNEYLIKKYKRERRKRKNAGLGSIDVFNNDSESHEIVATTASKKALVLSLFTKSGDAKLDAILPYIGDFLDDKLKGKLLIFGHHKNVLDGISRYLDDYGGVEYIRIDGSTPSKDRQSRVQFFQNSTSCRVAVLAITAAGVALTLTAAATIYFAEVYWTPGSLIQAEDRAHRIGQMSHVKVYYFLADGTIDDIVWPLVKKKIQVLGEVVEGKANACLHVNRVVAEYADDSEDGGEEDTGEQDSVVIVEVDDILPDIITAEITLASAPAAVDVDSEDDVHETAGADGSNEPEEKIFYQNPDQLALMYLHSRGLREWPTDGNQIEWIKTCIDKDLPQGTIDITKDQPATSNRARINDIIDLSVNLRDVPNIPKAMIAPSVTASRSTVPLQQQRERQNSTNYAIWQENQLKLLGHK